MCTVLLPPGLNPTAVNKYIISSSYVTYVSCVRIVKNKLVHFTCVNVVFVMNISIYVCRNYKQLHVQSPDEDSKQQPTAYEAET